MQYHCYTFVYASTPESLTVETVSDLLCQLLSEHGFDSFEYLSDGIKAYIPSDLLSGLDLLSVLASFPLPGLVVRYQCEQQPDIDWNHEWESKYFAPVRINEQCRIRAPFHPEDKQVEYDILIAPKMAFGTGNHQTTALVADYLFSLDLTSCHVLDMGCGTGILSIIAALRLAEQVLALDIDQWAVDNTIENARLNHVDSIESRVGNASLLPTKETFDLIVANIMRNVLLEDMSRYAQCLKSGGKLVMSGFYRQDLPALVECAQSLKLRLIESRVGQGDLSLLVVQKN